MEAKQSDNADLQAADELSDPGLHALRVLEFGEFLKLVAGYANSESARQWLRRLQPLSTMASIGTRHDLFRDVMIQIEEGKEVPRPSFEISSDLLQRVKPAEAVLGGEDLLGFRQHLEAVKEVKYFLAKETEPGLARLQEYGAQLTPCADLRRSLDRSIDKYGRLYDSASPALEEIRGKIRQLEVSIHARLEKLLNDTGLEDVFQDQFITLRKDRYVLPVRREMRNRLRGVVHDHSDSGQTLFVEPDEVLQEGNELAENRVEERDECRRLLKSLSEKVRGYLDELSVNTELLTELDAATAVGKWAQSYDCSVPTFSSRLRLFGARHPLLDKQFRETSHGKLVPLDLDMPEQACAVAITGSNSGGKTVVLKTLGLLTLIAKTGLPIPAHPDSEIKWFDQVFADIGDEQSISENLSTFTGHMRNIRDILNRLDSREKPLVLLDELGSGTDPLEGGALACSILGELADTSAVSLVTTHLGAVKTFVHEQDGMMNAAMRFDPDSLQPEYVLELGHPGASHALTIAEKLGLPDAVLQRARNLLNSDHMRLETVIAELEEEKRQVSEKEREAQRDLNTLQENRESLRQEVDELHKQRERLLHDAYREAAQTVSNTRQQMDRLLKEWKDTSQSPDAAQTGELREQVHARQTDLEKAASAAEPCVREPVDMEKLQEGDRVWVEKLRDHGRVIKKDTERNRVTVALGAIHFSVAPEELGQPEKTAAQQDEARHRARFHKPRNRQNVKTELNLHGYTVDEAITEVDKFLNNAVMNGLSQARIIHGHGSGRLQQGVHEYLRNHGLVTEYRLGVPGQDEGGDGVTVVTLTESFR